MDTLIEGRRWHLPFLRGVAMIQTVPRALMMVHRVGVEITIVIEVVVVTLEGVVDRRLEDLAAAAPMGVIHEETPILRRQQSAGPRRINEGGDLTEDDKKKGTKGQKSCSGQS